MAALDRSISLKRADVQAHTRPAAEKAATTGWFVCLQAPEDHSFGQRTETRDMVPVTGDFGSRTVNSKTPVPTSAPKSRVTAHKIVVIWLTATRRGPIFAGGVKPAADLLRLFSGSAVIFP
jgi:hypothetical protein